MIKAADPSAWTQIGEAMLRRRVELGLRSQVEAAEKAGLGLTLYNRLESSIHENLTPERALLLDRFLQWNAGSVERLLRFGEQPQVAEKTPEQELGDYEILREEVDEMKDRMSRLERDTDFLKSVLRECASSVLRRTGLSRSRGPDDHA